MQQRAQQLDAAGQLEQAGELYGRIARMMAAQKELNTYSSAKQCYERIKALDLWEALIHDLQKTYRALLFEVDLAEIAYLRGDKPGSLRLWREIIENNPQNDQAYALVGSAMMKYHLYEDAQGIYERGRKAFKDPDKFYQELVRVYEEQGSFTAMTEELVRFLQKYPQQLGFVQTQLLAAGDEQEASHQITATIERTLKSAKSFHPQGYQLLAALYTQGREYSKALRCYDYLESNAHSTKSSEGGQYYYTFAIVAMNDGALAQAREALEALIERADENNPYRTQAAATLAQLLEREGAYDQAAGAYLSFIKRYPEWPETPKLYLRLGSLYFDHFFDVNAADSVYEQLLKRPGVHASFRALAFQRRAECAIVLGDLTRAEGFLHALIRETPTASVQHRQASLMLAHIDLFKSQPKRALQKLEMLVTQANVQEAKADTVQNNVIELYLLLRENQQDSVGLSLLGQARWLHQKRQYAAAYDSLHSLLAHSPGASLGEYARFMQISLLRKMKRFSEALSICSELSGDSTTLAPDLALMTMAEIYQEQSEGQKAEQLLETFLDKYPGSIYIEQVRGRIRMLEMRTPVSRE